MNNWLQLRLKFSTYTNENSTSLWGIVIPHPPPQKTPGIQFSENIQFSMEVHTLESLSAFLSLDTESCDPGPKLPGHHSCYLTLVFFKHNGLFRSQYYKLKKTTFCLLLRINFSFSTFKKEQYYFIQ